MDIGKSHSARENEHGVTPCHNWLGETLYSLVLQLDMRIVDIALNTTS